jgi:hypothetical protein
MSISQQLSHNQPTPTTESQLQLSLLWTLSRRLTLLSLFPGSRTSCRPTSQSPDCRLRLLCPWPPSQGPEPPFSDWLSEFFSEDSLTQLTLWLLYWLKTELSSQSQSHFTTDGQSVSPSWFRAPSGAHDQILITVWHLLFCRCRGRVCHLY